MTLGESLGLIVLRVITMFHAALANYVSVTNVTQSDGGSQLEFTVLASGLDLAEWAADMTEIYMGVLGAAGRTAGFGVDLAKLFTILLS